MAISVVEFSHGLALPFIGLSVGKRWGQPPRDLGASREGAQSGLRTSSELGSERYKEQRSERSERYKEQRSERYKEQRSERYKEQRALQKVMRSAQLEIFRNYGQQGVGKKRPAR